MASKASMIGILKGLTGRMNQHYAMLSSQSKFNVVVYSTKSYDRHFLSEHLKGMNNPAISLAFEKDRLCLDSADKAKGSQAVCIFVNDDCGTPVVEKLAKQGVQMIALRCAGFNNVDLVKAREKGLKVSRVPAYSPYSVAEFTVGALLALIRKISVAYNRVRMNNFSLEGLVGFDIYGRTVGIIGAGKTGLRTASIYKGMGCKVLAYDPYPNDSAAKQYGFEFVSSPEEIYKHCDIISIHAPLTADNYHLVNEKAINMMKPNVIIINVGRGPLIDSKALLKGLKSGHIGGACLDVYENETDYFYDDHSGKPLQDDTLSLLISCPNVLVTSHQAYLTREALQNISESTLTSVEQVAKGVPLINEVK